MPIDYSNYHPEWKTRIRPDILKRAKNKCEFCGVENGAVGYRAGDGTFWIEDAESYIPDEVINFATKRKGAGKELSTIVLTIAHLDQDIENNRYENLRALCQRCHLVHDMNFKKRKKHAQRFANSDFTVKDKFMMLKNISNFFLYHPEEIRQLGGHPELWSFIASWFAENTIIQELDWAKFDNTTLKE